VKNTKKRRRPMQREFQATYFDANNNNNNNNNNNTLSILAETGTGSDNGELNRKKRKIF
jgi:hypothetical protein